MDEKRRNKQQQAAAGLDKPGRASPPLFIALEFGVESYCLPRLR